MFSNDKFNGPLNKITQISDWYRQKKILLNILKPNQTSPNQNKTMIFKSFRIFGIFSCTPLTVGHAGKIKHNL